MAQSISSTLVNTAPFLKVNHKGHKHVVKARPQVKPHISPKKFTVATADCSDIKGERAASLETFHWNWKVDYEYDGGKTFFTLSKKFN